MCAHKISVGIDELDDMNPSPAHDLLFLLLREEAIEVASAEIASASNNNKGCLCVCPCGLFNGNLTVRKTTNIEYFI